MTIAALFVKPLWQKFKLTHRDILRMLVAGCVWGLALTFGLTAMTFFKFGMICFDDLASTAAISVIAGIIAIGPIAAYGRH